jgi:hypothetical protein
MRSMSVEGVEARRGLEAKGCAEGSRERTVQQR